VIAAEHTSQRCRALNLDPGYVDTAIRSWQALIGDKARHATGRDFMTRPRGGGRQCRLVLRAGTTPVRQWRAHTYTVLVHKDGFEHEGQLYRP